MFVCVFVFVFECERDEEGERSEPNPVRIVDGKKTRSSRGRRKRRGLVLVI